MTSVDDRAVTPAVGVVLMLGIVVVLGVVVGAAIPQFAAGLDRSDVDRVVATPTATPAPAAGSELIRARDESPSATTRHVLNFRISDGSDTAGNSLNSIVLDYPAAVDLSGVDDRDDVVLVGIDADGDGSVEADATDDVECCPPDDGVKLSDGATTLTVELSGNYDLEEGDTLVLSFRDAENPSDAGDYEVTVGVNGDVTRTGTLAVT